MYIYIPWYLHGTVSLMPTLLLVPKIRTISFHMFVFHKYNMYNVFTLSNGTIQFSNEILPWQSSLQRDPIISSGASLARTTWWDTSAKMRNLKLLMPRFHDWVSKSPVGEQHVFLCWWHPPFLRWWNWWKYVGINSCYFLWWTQCLCLPCNCFHWFS